MRIATNSRGRALFSEITSDGMLLKKASRTIQAGYDGWNPPEDETADNYAEFQDIMVRGLADEANALIAAKTGQPGGIDPEVYLASGSKNPAGDLLTYLEDTYYPDLDPELSSLTDRYSAVLDNAHRSFDIAEDYSHDRPNAKPKPLTFDTSGLDRGV